ncbi:MAG: hypothetical protein ABIP51_22280 [Bacteroidia bacterium]
MYIYPFKKIKIKIKYFLFGVIPLLFHSCFLLKIPVPLTHNPIKDTVNVYHFMISANRKKIADSTTSNKLVRESKKAYDWISMEASRHGQNLVFKEFWPVNKDTNYKNTFIHKLPRNSLQTLYIKKTFLVVTRKKTKTQPEKIERVNWNPALFDSLTKQIKDSSIIKIIPGYKTPDLLHQANRLVVVHLLKARKSKLNGYYQPGNAVFIGNNRSRTIAHESIHYLGAPDLYIHKYWIGKRRRIVRKELRQEIMDRGVGKKTECTAYYVSNYTAYTIGWDKEIKKEYKPLLKQNLMAKIIFYLSLLL